jgi:hypothetical protein
LEKTGRTGTCMIVLDAVRAILLDIDIPHSTSLVSDCMICRDGVRIKPSDCMIAMMYIVLLLLVIA